MEGIPENPLYCGCKREDTKALWAPVPLPGAATTPWRQNGHGIQISPLPFCLDMSWLNWKPGCSCLTHHSPFPVPGILQKILAREPSWWHLPWLTGPEVQEYRMEALFKIMLDLVLMAFLGHSVFQALTICTLTCRAAEMYRGDWGRLLQTDLI